jgi:CDP-ribitol ribitolphosphotransferase
VSQPVATLDGIGWERIQLVVRLRPADGASLGDVQLVRTDPGPAEPMRPTWRGVDGEATIARFNVMLGPGQQPLDGGTWVLHAGDGDDGTGPLRIEGADVVEVFLAERTFAYRGGRYRVAPCVERDRQSLALDIARLRSAPRRRPWHRRSRTWLRRTIKPRQRIFRMLAAIFRATAPRTRRRIVFTSDSHATLTGNLAAVHDRMVERGLDGSYQLDTIFKPSVTARRSWRDRWRLPRLLGRADVILLDDYQPVIYRLGPNPRQRIIQLWHASGAFKTVGYSRIGKPGGPSPFARRHKNYTYAIVSGQHDVPYYAEAFGLPEERVLPTGIPRMDRFFDEDKRAEGVALARRLFPASEGRTTILFAPTFRGNGPRDAAYDYGLIDWASLHATCVTKDAVMIVRMHPFIREPAPIPAGLRDRILDGTDAPIDVNDLLFAVDLLITDYSSIVFEFATLLRPMLFFAYDLEEYVAGRDFYAPFEDFVPGRIAGTFDEVLAAIRADDFMAEKVPDFARRHFDHLDGGATDRVIDELILAS